MSKRWILAYAGLGLVVATGVAIFLWSSASPPRVDGRAAGAPAKATTAPGLPGGLVSWRDNGSGGRYVAPVIRGVAPTVETLGTVRTDTDCAPDGEGLSHCHNQIKLASGGTVTIQDNHDMSVNPCLSPGDEVSVEPLMAGWLVIRKQAGT